MNSSHGKILSIDYGSRRIGIALSDPTRTIAFGKEALKNDEKYLEKIAELVRDDNVSEIVIGYPLNMKGNKSAQTIETEEFEEELRNYLNASFDRHIDIIRWDERLTSKMAMDSMLESGMKKKNRRKKENLDIISATLLLQSYLDSKGSSTLRSPFEGG